MSIIDILDTVSEKGLSVKITFSSDYQELLMQVYRGTNKTSRTFAKENIRDLTDYTQLVVLEKTLLSMIEELEDNK